MGLCGNFTACCHFAAVEADAKNVTRGVAKKNT